MKRPSLFRRLLNKVRGSKERAALPQVPETKPRKATNSSFEPLEGRIAPAVLLNPNTIQFTDTDGDLVTIKFSKALFKSDAVNLNDTLDSVFKFFSGGTVRTAADGGSAADVHELAKLDLSALAGSTQEHNPAEGTDIIITAEPQNGGGNGHVNVGYIKAAVSSLYGISLGKVVVEGDLGQIDAGNHEKSVAIKSLTVDSWGTLGTTTQLTDSTTSLESNITSGIGKITVNGDFKDATLKVINGGTTTAPKLGKIGTLFIGDNLFANPASTTANAGFISTSSDIGSVLVGNIIGSGGSNSGAIKSSGKIGSVWIAGDLRGGDGSSSGLIDASKGIGKVKMGDLWAGTGSSSGRIHSGAGIGSITLHSIAGHHSFSGGDAGDNAATIAATTSIGTVSIAGNVSGGMGDNSGSISAATTLTKITIGGHLIGGEGAGSGQIVAGGNISAVTIQGASQTYTSVVNQEGTVNSPEEQAIELGDVLDLGSGAYRLTFAGQTTTPLSSDATAAQIQAALEALSSIGTGNVTVNKSGGRLQFNFTANGDQAGFFTATADQGSMVGFTGSGSASITSNKSIAKITIGNSLLGAGIVSGSGDKSASITAAGNLGTVVINGDLDGSRTDAAASGASINAGGNIQSVTINGLLGLIAGDGNSTGSILAGVNIGTVKVRDLKGGAGDYSGSIVAGGSIHSAVLSESKGGDGASSGSLIVGADFNRLGNLDRVTSTGLVGGDGVDSGTIRVAGKIGFASISNVDAGTHTLHDAMVGGLGSNSGSVIAGKGASKVQVVGYVVGGDGEYSGSIQAFGNLASVQLTGGITGGNGEHSGSIHAHDFNGASSITPGNIGKVSFTQGSLSGGAGADSGQIRADGSIGSVTNVDLNGNTGSWSGSIVAGAGDSAFNNDYKTIGGIGTLNLKGLSGDASTTSGSIQANGKIGSVTVNGNVSQATIQSGRDIGSLTINGDLSHSLVSALGSVKATATSDLAIGKLSALSVNDTVIRAGYDRFGDAANGNAQIGAVNVTGDWTESSLVAGVVDTNSDGFGNADDAVITGGTISRIASIVIGGNVTGTAGAGDHFGFVAHTIGSAKIGGVAQTLTPGIDNIDLAGNPATNDTSIHEVA